MKPEILKALASKLEANSESTPDPLQSRALLVNALRGSHGPTIDPTELARLVEMRLRKGATAAAVSPEQMVNEIEATLDLVEACDVMLAARRRQWQPMALEIRNALFKDEKPTEIEKAIRAATYPMSFTAGLIKMGVPEKGRKDKYWQFFKEKYPLWQWVESSSGQSLSDFMASRTFTDKEINAAFEKRKAEGWPNAFFLENIESQWRKWWAVRKHDGQIVGGKKSAKVRAEAKAEAEKKAKAAQLKNKPAQLKK